MNISTLSHGRRLIKTLVVMKLTVLLIILACFKVSATAYAQDITLNEKNASFAKILKQIEKQSGYIFFYNNNLLKQTRPVSISLEKVPLLRALEKCFANQPLTYQIIDNTIIVKTKEKTVIQKLKQVLGLPINIKGRITDTTGRALPGAVVKVKGSNTTVSTNDIGEFEISGISENSVLVVTYIGYITTEVRVNELDKTQAKIILRQNVMELNSVIVVSTGYQSIPKERVTGSFAQPIKQMYDLRVSTDLISKLEGITSGTAFNSPGVTGTQFPKVSIRGRSTLYANDNPLIVVDNFPYDGNINNINPNDVETITILKDAAAASIWGVQAGNGVIVVTTKKGKLSKPLKIEFNSNFTKSEKPDLYYDRNFLNSADFIEVEKLLFSQGAYDYDISSNDPTNVDSRFPPLSPVVSLLSQVRNGTISSALAEKQISLFKNLDIRDDLSKYFYRPAFNQQYAINLSGGSEKASYYFSGGYDKNLQNLRGNQFDRLTVNSLNTFSPLKNLILTTGVNYVQSNSATDNTLSQVRTGGNYSNIYPYAQLTNGLGDGIAIISQYSSDFVKYTQGKGFLSWELNPLDELNNHYNTDENRSNDLRLSTGINYSILKGLSADVKYQYQKNSTTNNSLATQNSFYARYQINRMAILDNNGNVIGNNWPVGGLLTKSFSNLNSHHARGQINYNYSSLQHKLTAIAGAEITQVETDGTRLTLYGYDENLGTSKPVDYIHSFPIWPDGYSTTIPGTPGISGTLDRFRSYFTNAAYTYRDKYTISASGRIDASNYFAVKSNQKAVPLWSTGVKWDLYKENFYHVNWLSVLVFRGSFGYQGNLDKTLTAVPTLNLGTIASFTNAQKATVRNYGNPDLRWEKNRTINAGLDFEVAGNRLTGSLEYYSKRGIDLIGFTVLPPSSGVVNMKGNYSGTSGDGIDIQLNSENLRGKKFKWNTMFLLSYARDRVTDYTGTNVSPSGLIGQGYNITPVIGRPAYSLYSYKWQGLDPTTGDPQGIDVEGNISKDYGTLINVNSLQEIEYNGSARPVTFGGIYNRFSFHELSLAFNISYKLGYFFRRTSLSYSQLFTMWVGHEEYAQRWQKSGDEKNTVVPSQIYPSDSSRDYFYQYSSATIEKGDHIRLQDITLSYDLTKAKIRRLPFERAQFYAYANNIGILWRANKIGIDPDYPYVGIPSTTTYSLGVKLFF